jgi:transaldolase
MYVTELIAPNTVNTMPEGTLDAVADHGEISGPTVTPNYDSARNLLDALNDLGISYDDVVLTLEREGVQKFVASWEELLATVRNALEEAADEATRRHQARLGEPGRP